MAGLRERGKPAWTRSAATTASPFGQGQGQGHGQGHGHEKTARPQADGRLQGKTSLSPAQENLHPFRFRWSGGLGFLINIDLVGGGNEILRQLLNSRA